MCTLTVQANAILAAWLPFARLYLICHTKTATLQLPGPSLVCTVVPIALGRLDANQPNLLSRVCPFTPQSADTQSGNKPSAPTSIQETPSMLRNGAGGLRINAGGLSIERRIASRGAGRKLIPASRSSASIARHFDSLVPINVPLTLAAYGIKTARRQPFANPKAKRESCIGTPLEYCCSTDEASNPSLFERRPFWRCSYRCEPRRLNRLSRCLRAPLPQLTKTERIGPGVWTPGRTRTRKSGRRRNASARRRSRRFELPCECMHTQRALVGSAV